MSYIHSLIINKVKFYKEIQLFSLFEFNLLNYCNRKCEFCPVIVPYEKKELSLEYYIYTLLQLREIDYSGVIVFSGFSEPLLHTELYYLVDLKSKLVPKSHLTINTNGDKLTNGIIDVLLKKGVNDINISQYEEGNHLDRFKNIKNVYIKDRFSNDDFINNRAGSLYNIDKPLKNICYYPYYSLFINYNGDILFCPHNYKGKNKLGNIRSDNLIDIWKGKSINKIRGNRESIPCNNCNVIGDLAGEKQYKSFLKNEKRKKR